MPLTQALAQQVALVGHSLHKQLSEALQLAGRPVEFQAAVSAAVQSSLTALEATGIVGWDNKQPSVEFWAAAADLLEFGSLQVHARTKPVGLPWRFSTARTHLSAGTSPTRILLGTRWTPFFRTKRLLTQSVIGAGKLPNRIKALAEEATTTCTVTSLGCGPAWGRSPCYFPV